MHPVRLNALFFTSWCASASVSTFVVVCVLATFISGCSDACLDKWGALFARTFGCEVTRNNTYKPPKMMGYGLERRPGGLLLAGSGTNVPITRILVKAYVDSLKRARALKILDGLIDAGVDDVKYPIIDVPADIGSAAGIMALVSGEVDGALISRPLTASERALDLTVLPYARTAIGLIAHPMAPNDAFGATDLVPLVRAEHTRWSTGDPIVLFIRQSRYSGNAVFDEHVPGFARAIDWALWENRWRVYFSDTSMIRKVEKTPLSLGFADVGAVRALDAKVKFLPLDGVVPSAGVLDSGNYPYEQTLCFVARKFANEQLLKFFDWVRSEEGFEVLKQYGYLPETHLQPPRIPTFDFPLGRPVSKKHSKKPIAGPMHNATSKPEVLPASGSAPPN